MSTAANTLEFIGLSTAYKCADGDKRRRIHLDGAASPLAARAGMDMHDRLLPHYSNSHSYVHNSAQISTKALEWAHKVVLEFLGANEKDYTAVFCGSGSTAALNRIARGLHKLRGNRKQVLISSMEHHANDLPHRQFDNECLYLKLTGEGRNQGAIDLEELEQLCRSNQDSINYLAISSVSNVTGIRNPIKHICEIAHRYNIFVVVDAAQSVAHGESHLNQINADFWVFSGHKLYTPTAPGVMVAKRSILRVMQEQDLGGGSVVDVTQYDYILSNDTSTKEESGTPNIVGAVSLAATMEAMKTAGLESILQKEVAIMTQLLSGLKKIDGIVIYGDLELPRTAAIAFNHRDIEHGLVAAILNDYFCIAVRNECFCAQPYVSSLLKEELWQIDLSTIEPNDQETIVNSRRGMVRISLSAYTTQQDIEFLLNALNKIVESIDKYRQQYRINKDGSFTHLSFSVDWREALKA